jgi:hypothetical protein
MATGDGKGSVSVLCQQGWKRAGFWLACWDRQIEAGVVERFVMLDEIFH